MERISATRHFVTVLGIVAGAAMSIGQVTGNAYVLDGRPTGLSAIPGGSVTISGGLYRASGSKAGSWVRGPAKFKFRWVPDATQPEPPPQSAIVKITTTASANQSTDGTANNGWSTVRGNAASQGTRATEHLVRVRPGRVFEISVPVSASAGRSGTGCSVSVGVQVTPVRVVVSGTTWFGTPKAPHILLGERARAALRAGEAALSDVRWTVAGRIFRDFDPQTTPSPRLGHVSPAMLRTAEPEWYWTSTRTAPATVRGQAKVTFPENRFHRKTATVIDACTVHVVRPTLTVKMLTLDDSPIPNLADRPVKVVGPRTLTRGGTVVVPVGFTPGGTYAFVQVVQTLDSNGVPKTSRLDGAFPYPLAANIYAVGMPAKFLDFPLKASERNPLPGNHRFVTTIIFKPNRLDSRWTPLASVAWSWDKTTGKLKLPTPATWVPTDQHPTWSGTFNLIHPAPEAAGAAKRQG